MTQGLAKASFRELRNVSALPDDAGALQVRVYGDRDAMGRAAALDIAAALRETIADKGGARVIFAAAPSQITTIDALLEQDGIDWSHVTGFHMDEYLGIDPSHPSGFGQWLRRHLFERQAFGAVHIIPTMGNANLIAREYAAMLNEAPIDIVCLGVGVNGHIAFNEPDAANFSDTADVKPVELDQVCIQQQVDDGCFPDTAAVPPRALTLTVPRLLRAERLFAIVPGASKRAALKCTLYGPLTSSCPASALRTHDHCNFYLDEEAAPDAED